METKPSQSYEFVTNLVKAPLESRQSSLFLYNDLWLSDKTFFIFLPQQLRYLVIGLKLFKNVISDLLTTTQVCSPPKVGPTQSLIMLHEKQPHVLQQVPESTHSAHESQGRLGLGWSVWVLQGRPAFSPEPIWGWLCFQIHGFLSWTAFSVSRRCRVVVFSLSFVSRHLLIASLISL